MFKSKKKSEINTKGERQWNQFLKGKKDKGRCWEKGENTEKSKKRGNEAKNYENKVRESETSNCYT